LLEGLPGWRQNGLGPDRQSPAYWPRRRTGLTAPTAGPRYAFAGSSAIQGKGGTAPRPRALDRVADLPPTGTAALQDGWVQSWRVAFDVALWLNAVLHSCREGRPLSTGW